MTAKDIITLCLVCLLAAPLIGAINLFVNSLRSLLKAMRERDNLQQEIIDSHEASIQKLESERGSDDQANHP